jgi:chromosome segregation ATPase
MSDEELRDQINRIAVQIEKIEQVAKQKESYISNKLNQEFGPKMSEIEGKLQHQQSILKDLNRQIDDLTSKKKELLPIVKNLENEYNNLKKQREKSLNLNLKAIEKEKKTKTKDIDRQIKLLEKELKAIETK